MTFTTVADLVLGLAVVVLICVRQLRWTAVRPSRLWRLPLVLAVVGALSLLQTGGRTFTGADVALLLVEAAVAVVTGAGMGAITVFRPIRSVPSLRDGEAVPTLECRTGWLGLALWAVLVAVRIGIALLGHQLGAAAAESTGVILLVIALNRAGRAAVVQARLGAAAAVAAR